MFGLDGHPQNWKRVISTNSQDTCVRVDSVNAIKLKKQILPQVYRTFKILATWIAHIVFASTMVLDRCPIPKVSFIALTMSTPTHVLRGPLLQHDFVNVDVH